MSQLSLFDKSIWTITDITRHLRDLLESDYTLQDLWVQGEVSNFSRPNSGHVYFTLKDASCALKCVMWRNTVLRQSYVPRNGDLVEVHGSITVYEAAGQYQLYADSLRPAGEGQLFQEFLRLKALLEAEGLFEPERKRPIPSTPHRIGIVTSPTGAALRDMLNTIRRRYPLVELVLSPTPVQGVEAPSGIVAAIRALNRIAQPDVILVARGGGSIEDLWAFNDEQVARAIADSQAPVICGVGHETDFTIADFASDLRAATPTAAAELATPNRADLLLSLHDLQRRLGQMTQSVLNDLRWELNSLENQLIMRSPQVKVRADRQRLDDFSRRASLAVSHQLRLERTRIFGFEQRLSALNPLAVLNRGYAVIERAEGGLVRSVTEVAPGAAIQVRLSDGRFDAQVGTVHPDEEPEAPLDGAR